MISFFFFNYTATTEIYTLSLHDALPISILHSKPATLPPCQRDSAGHSTSRDFRPSRVAACLDRKSTRLNSSHSQISYAVLCLKKKQIKSHIMTVQYH